MLTLDWNITLGQSVFNFIRHAVEGASAEILQGLRLEVETLYSEVQRLQVQLEPAVLDMLKMALEQDIETPKESAPLPAAAAPEVKVTAPQRPNYPLYFPQMAPPVERKELHVQPTFIRPAQNGNGNASWVGSRNAYARYFSSQNQ